MRRILRGLVVVVTLLAAAGIAGAFTINSVTTTFNSYWPAGGGLPAMICFDVHVSVTVVPGDPNPVGPIHITMGDDDGLLPDDISPTDHDVYHAYDASVFSDPSVTSVTYTWTFLLCFEIPNGWQDFGEGYEGEWYVTASGGSGSPVSSTPYGFHPY